MTSPSERSDGGSLDRSERIAKIVIDCLTRRCDGDVVSDESLIAEHPDLMPELGDELRGLRLVRAARERFGTAPKNEGPAEDENAIDINLGPESFTDLFVSDSTDRVFVRRQPQGDAVGMSPAWTDFPSRIGRYRIERVLGQGGFGVVFLAHDERLDRSVAIKVPIPAMNSQSPDFEAYLSEARMVAKLDHPNIVSVYDVGFTDEIPCFIVSMFVEGVDVAARIKQSRFTHAESAKLVATVADALHYAHNQGIVHRDVKPANILIDKNGKPYLVDFGLALRDERVGHGPRYLGTAAYMSPEQARGEGHRVDGRSDVYSLGTVLYELLLNRRPFRGETHAELLSKIATFDVRPLRQYDHRIPQELDRICQKAMAKRAADRYSTAKDLADELRRSAAQTAAARGSQTSDGAASITATDASDSSSKTVSPTPSNIVPKGLRSFDAHDFDFFLQLVPGPRDRLGLPGSLRFWKFRIEEKDPDATFSVGLIFGPSGCGKSSLVKAGLLPRLSQDVISVYVEAAADGMEARVLRGLRKQFPAMGSNLTLPQFVAALRQGEGLSSPQKVLIVIDQFEQWLHANKERQDTELVRALRQCDGGRVQALVMVRDDFWLAVSRFLRELEVRLVEDENYALVDRFDIDHSVNVLRAFGRAFGKLPEDVRQETKEQREFLTQAVAGLAIEGRVVCVRLALFAEMMKNKSWTLATLNEVGGAEGIGASFLEETFISKTASPSHRYHKKAACAILKTLLPNTGADIKGRMKSSNELLEASGYAHRPQDFHDVMRVLDQELRLITPTDPEGVEFLNNESIVQAARGMRHYELTHDYLVPSLRDWLFSKQKQTIRGRTQLLLDERATTWRTKRDRRSLPSLWEWLLIFLFVSPKNRDATEREMMMRATSHYFYRIAIVAGVFALIVFASIESKARNASRTTLLRLVQADASQLPEILLEMQPRRNRMLPLIRQAYDKELASPRSEASDTRRLNFCVALLPSDPSHVDFLTRKLLESSLNEFRILVDALQPYQTQVVGTLWETLSDPAANGHLQAASALAAYAPDQPKWNAVADTVVTAVTGMNAISLGPWIEFLRPVRGQLIPALARTFRNTANDAAVERSIATDLLAEFAVDRPDVLADLLLDADAGQYATLFPKLASDRESAIVVLEREFQKATIGQATSSLDDPQRRQIPSGDNIRQHDWSESRRASAAIGLIRLEAGEQVWSLLADRRGTTARHHFIHRFCELGGDPEVLIQRLHRESNAQARRSLLVALGEFDRGQLSVQQRQAMADTLATIHRTDDNAGVHSAAEWVAGVWDMDLKQSEADSNADPKMSASRGWYTNQAGQTMAVISGGEFLMGDDEIGQVRRHIDRTFAIATKEVTHSQFQSFLEFVPIERSISTRAYNPTDDSPAVHVSWYAAAAYCNWLSAQDGIDEEQWCYLPNADGNFADGMQVAHGFLERTGYRLPTEAEWEYACRAHTMTPWNFGVHRDYLRLYAWIRDDANKSRPVGGLRPNEFGLFDMYGNVWEWCQDSLHGYTDDTGAFSTEAFDPAARRVEDRLRRHLRGGGYLNPEPEVNSSNRFDLPPRHSQFDVGFRVARTHRVLRLDPQLENE